MNMGYDNKDKKRETPPSQGDSSQQGRSAEVTNATGVTNVGDKEKNTRYRRYI
jgi:hypothetical protein